MAKITITKGKPYYLAVVIKQPGSLNPADLTTTAIATFFIISKDDNKKEVEKLMTRLGNLEDAKFLLELDETETSLLPSNIILPEDGSIADDTCRGHIHIEDTANPLAELRHIDVILPKIYVTDLGE